MKTEDEYVWKDYTAEYSAQLNEILTEDNQDFFITKFNIGDKGGNIEFTDNLHPNWMEIYAAAHRLQPTSVFEFGCGGCYHLKNLHNVLGHTNIYGADLLQTQLDFGKQFSALPESIANKLSVCDLTNDKPTGQYEFVYSQAVVMHLSTENAYKFLHNMKASSYKYVFLIEGVKNHANWYDMVKEVFFDWDFSQPNVYVDYSILLTKKD